MPQRQIGQCGLIQRQRNQQHLKQFSAQAQHKSTALRKRRYRRGYDFNLSGHRRIKIIKKVSVITILIILGAFIRTRNLKWLQGKYLLALDPYLFLRYAEYIVEHGKLFIIDNINVVGVIALVNGSNFLCISIIRTSNFNLKQQ